MTTYTKIAKPSTSYTKISGGHILYDDTMTAYDSTASTYDGLSGQSGWTNIPKATGGNTTATAGMYYGFGAFTYSGGQTLSTGIWTKIPKAN